MSLRWQGLRHRYAEGASLSYADLDLPGRPASADHRRLGQRQVHPAGLADRPARVREGRLSVMGQDLAYRCPRRRLTPGAAGPWGSCHNACTRARR